MHAQIHHIFEIYSALGEFIKSSDTYLKQRNSKYTTRELLEFYVTYFGLSSSTYSKASSSLQSKINQMPSPSTISYYNNKRNIDDYKTLNNDILTIWDKRYPSSKISTIVPGRRVLAADGSVVKVRVSGLKEGTVSHVTLCTLTDISCSILVNVAIATDKDERKGFIGQLEYVNKQDICVFDRGYLSVDFIALVNKHTTFVIRMKSNSSLCSRFQNSIETNIVEIVNGVTLRLVKYFVDVETKQVVRNYYNDNNNSSVEDENISEFILCTNDLSLTVMQLSNIYKARWQCEVNHKALKQNYNIRTLCSTKSKSHDDIRKRCEINSLMITIMFNISRMFEYTTIDAYHGTPLYGNKFAEPSTGIVKRLNFTKVSATVTNDIASFFIGVGGNIRKRVVGIMKRISSWKNSCHHDNLEKPATTSNSVDLSPNTKTHKQVSRKSLFTVLSLFHSPSHTIHNENEIVSNYETTLKRLLHQTVSIYTFDVSFL